MKKIHDRSCLVYLLSMLFGLFSFAESVYWTASPRENAMQSYHWFLAVIAFAVIGATALAVAHATTPKVAS